MHNDAQRWFYKKICNFKKDEDGGIMILALMLFVCMIVAGGLAVDLANHERTRTYLQTHLDNAVLAAASLSQDMDSEDVVLSYMASSGVDTSTINVETDIERIGGIVVGRTVYATMNDDVRTYFFRYFDYDALEMTIESRAVERVEDIEISLALDVSGSMKRPTSDGRSWKIDALKQAASVFVDEVLSEAEEGRVSISIIPYSTKVNAGADLLDYYNTTTEHDYSHCVDFEEDDFRSLSIYPNSLLQRTAHFQFQGTRTYDYWEREWVRDDPSKGEWACRIDQGFEITPLSSSAIDLKAHIDSLTPEGSTSIDVGVKWALALLDESAQGPVSALVAEGKINPAFRGRPHPHSAQNNMKVLVIMTDGENQTEYRMRDKYASGESNVFKFTAANGDGPYYNVVSEERSGANDGSYPYGEDYFYPPYPTPENHKYLWDGRLWSNMLLNEHTGLSENYRQSLNKKKLTWPEIWNEMSPDYFAHNFIGKQENNSRDGDYERDRFWDKMIKTVSADEKDDRLRDICATARAAGIVTYTIGMEVKEDDSLELLKECASTEAHYFDVEGMELQTAFEMIASSISMLRLTK